MIQYLALVALLILAMGIFIAAFAVTAIQIARLASYVSDKRASRKFFKIVERCRRDFGTESHPARW